MSKAEELCTDCPNRSICSCLCPEAETYARQDEVALRELPIGLPVYQRNDWPDPAQKSLFSKRERDVLWRLGKGQDRETIAQQLGITRKNLREIIRRLKKIANSVKPDG